MDQIEIPEDVIEGLLEVRESGLTNMFDRNAVIRIMNDNGWNDAAMWLYDNEQSYMDALNEMGKLV